MKARPTGKKTLHTPPQEFKDAAAVRAGAVWQARMKLDREKYEAGIQTKSPAHPVPLTAEQRLDKYWYR